MVFRLETCYFQYVQKQRLMLRVAVLAGCALPPFLGADSGSKAFYVGGTVAAIHRKSTVRIDCTGSESLNVHLAHGSLTVPYRDINTIEYGMRVNRRYVEALLISPVFLVAKKRSHFLTVGYEDADGNQQAMILEVGKDEIRPLLVSLEARTGRRVEYQDEEARKAGKG
jgi:hypothetical protein